MVRFPHVLLLIHGCSALQVTVSPLQPAECRDAAPGEWCHSASVWAKEEGARQLPDRFPGDVHEYSVQDFQSLLHHTGRAQCLRPCSLRAAGRRDSLLQSGAERAHHGFSAAEWEEVMTSTWTSDPSPTPVLEAGLDEGAPEGGCTGAPQGSLCRHSVRWLLEAGLEKHPDWYPGLSTGSSFRDVQTTLHILGKANCSMPCESGGQDQGPETGRRGQKLSDGPESCGKPQVGDWCYDSIEWLRSTGLRAHPDWYPGITEASTAAEVQSELYGSGKAGCLMPCPEDEDATAENATPSPEPLADGDCHDAVEVDSACFKEVVKVTMEGVKLQPELYRGLTDASSFKEVQEYLFHHRTAQCDMPCPDPEPPAQPMGRGGFTQKKKVESMTIEELQSFIDGSWDGYAAVSTTQRPAEVATPTAAESAPAPPPSAPKPVPAEATSAEAAAQALMPAVKDQGDAEGNASKPAEGAKDQGDAEGNASKAAEGATDQGDAVGNTSKPAEGAKDQGDAESNPSTPAEGAKDQGDAEGNASKPAEGANDQGDAESNKSTPAEGAKDQGNAEGNASRPVEEAKRRIEQLQAQMRKLKNLAAADLDLAPTFADAIAKVQKQIDAEALDDATRNKLESKWNMMHKLKDLVKNDPELATSLADTIHDLQKQIDDLEAHAKKAANASAETHAAESASEPEPSAPAAAASAWTPDPAAAAAAESASELGHGSAAAENTSALEPGAAAAEAAPAPQPASADVEHASAPEPGVAAAEAASATAPSAAAPESSSAPEPAPSAAAAELAPGPEPGAAGVEGASVLEPSAEAAEAASAPEPGAADVDDASAPEPGAAAAEGVLGPEPGAAATGSSSAPESGAAAEQGASQEALATSSPALQEEADTDEELLPLVDDHGVETSAATEVEQTGNQDAAVEATQEVAQAAKEDETYEAGQEAAEGSHNGTSAQAEGTGSTVAGQEDPLPTLVDADASPAETSATDPEPLPELEGGSEDSADVAALKKKIRDLEEDLAKALSSSTRPAGASTVATPREAREQLKAGRKAGMLRQAVAELTAEVAARQARERPAVEAPGSTAAARAREEQK